MLIACLVWTIAGANIVRIGLEAYVKHVTVWNIVLSVVVFVLFQWFVFGKLVKKHTARIIGYEGKQWFIKFFDLKAFMIMAVMMLMAAGPEQKQRADGCHKYYRPVHIRYVLG